MHDTPQIFVCTLQRDLQVYAQHKSEWLSTVLFFVIIVSLFPLALGPFTNDALYLVPGIIWVAALLATVLGQESLWRADYQSGVFEQCIVGPHSLSIIVLAKILANFLVNGLPLILVTPLLASSFGLAPKIIFNLTYSVLLGIPVLCLVATLGTALTISLARGGLLLAILILPLYVPVLVLGASAGVLSMQGHSITGQLALLLALVIACLLLVPVAVSAVIKASCQ